MRERTLTIIKPDAVAAGHVGAIIQHLQREGFAILGVKRLRLTQAQAEKFYEVHRERPFYPSLVAFMTSGPVWVLALERDNAVAHLREVMGATDPAKAAPGTIRSLYGSSIERNAIHGSDSRENASLELAFFFSTHELVEA
ncbi:MAG: nucleoside-diphosphate kinase [Thermoanaerobaculum sp.]|nr:nucleoside-diphosphate kinase [Thermoanaerobaculum sp.]MDW7967022.1 nucleoside-diphosphate kinase [Thermoanaerobaculum sp.]